MIALAFGCVMLAIAVSDWRSYRVPDVLTVLALALRVVDLRLQPDGETLFDASLRAAVLAGLFAAFRWLYRMWRKREGMGLGDVKLAAVAGAWVDWPTLPYVVEAAALIGLALGLARGAHARGDMRLPFAVGFAPAIFAGWECQRLGF